MARTIFETSPFRLPSAPRRSPTVRKGSQDRRAGRGAHASWRGLSLTDECDSMVAEYCLRRVSSAHAKFLGAVAVSLLPVFEPFYFSFPPSVETGSPGISAEGKGNVLKVEAELVSDRVRSGGSRVGSFCCFHPHARAGRLRSVDWAQCRACTGIQGPGHRRFRLGIRLCWDGGGPRGVFFTCVRSFCLPNCRVHHISFVI